MQPASITLAGVTSNVPAARRFVEQTLAQWDLGDLAWTATLLVSELAANACLHARTRMTIALERTPAGGVRLDVTDGSPAIPRMRHYAEQATTGRGLRLVEDLSRSWGVEQTATGKVVWAELAPEATGGWDRADMSADADVDIEALLRMFPDEAGGTVSAATGQPARSAAGPLTQSAA